MIGRLFRKPRTDIFHFRENGRKRSADPMLVRRRMDAANPKWLEVTQVAGVRPVAGMPLADSYDVVRTADGAIAELCRVVREGFGVKQYDGREGMTEAEQMELLAAFLRWMTEAGEAASFFPPSPPSTVPPDSEGSTTGPSAE